MTNHEIFAVRSTRQLRARKTSFPGWGKPDQYDHFVDHPAGTLGEVTARESHGANPWTRYTIVWTVDGSTSNGIDPKDVTIL